MEIFFGLFVAAVFVEGTIEYFFGKTDKDGNNVSQPWLKFAAAGLGVGVCVVFGLDLFGSLGLTTTLLPAPFAALVGSALTGLVVGRGSNYLNDFITRVREPKPEIVVEKATTVNNA